MERELEAIQKKIDENKIVKMENDEIIEEHED